MTMRWPEMCDRFCGLSISKYLCSCFSPETEMEETPPKKDWFLYLTMPDLICRLNIDEFCKRNSENPLLFECLYELKDDDTDDDASHPDGDDDCPDGDDYYHPSKIPTGQHIKIPLDGRHTLVGSKLYIEGSDGSSPDCNLVTYCFDPTDPEGPSLSQCEGSIPELFCYRGTGIEGKFYFLAKDYGYGTCGYPSLTVFGEDQSWKALPHLPSFCGDVSVPFALGHKLVVSTTSQSFMFNTREEKWEDGPIKKEINMASFVNDLTEDIVNNEVSAVVEFKGFLIAVPRFGKRLVAYRWDSNGVPTLHRVLHELDVIFCPFLFPSYFAMGKCDGGRMWLVYVGKDLMDCRYTRVAVFRVSISNDPAGNPVLSADLEAAEFYYFHNCFASSINLSFALCHQPNGDDKKNFCGTIVDHPRC